MIGSIILPYKAPIIPPDPKDFFDPETHIATEANFIKLLEAEIYSDEIIGYKVQLSNSTDYNNGLQVIADVNHDSANTGQTNCYDLISQDAFYYYSFYNTYGNPSQRGSGCYSRTQLNETFYPGFNIDFKSHIIKPKYNSMNTQYNDDQIILPSAVEVGNNQYAQGSDQGVIYPIFNNTTNRIKNQYGTSTACNQQTRTYYRSYDGLYVILANGNYEGYSGTSYQYHAPVIRVS